MLKLEKHWKQLLAFALLFGVGLAVAATELYREHMVVSGYKNSPPVIYYPTLFKYAAFSIIAILYPWNRPDRQKKLSSKILIIAGIGLVFVPCYLFGVSVLEWTASSMSYRLWNGYRFTLIHSAPASGLTYATISCLLYFYDSRFGNIESSYPKSLSYKERNKTSFVPVKEIVFIKSADNYASVKTSGSGYLIRETLSSLEKRLDPSDFQRIHRKYIVNLRMVDSWESDGNGGYNILMRNEQSIRMSKSYVSKLEVLNRAKHT